MATPCPQPGWTARSPQPTRGLPPHPQAGKPLLLAPVPFQPTSPSLLPVMGGLSRPGFLSHLSGFSEVLCTRINLFPSPSFLVVPSSRGLPMQRGPGVGLQAWL